MSAGPERGPVGTTDRRTWEEFRESGLLWWTNRMLHLFGWAIVGTVHEDDETKVVEVYPARVSFRGFTDEVEGRGFRKLTKHLEQELPQMKKDAES